MQSNVVYILQAFNWVRFNNQSLKYQRFTPSGWKDIGIRKFEIVAMAQFFFKVGKRKHPLEEIDWESDKIVL